MARLLALDTVARERRARRRGLMSQALLALVTLLALAAPASAGEPTSKRVALIRIEQLGPGINMPLDLGADPFVEAAVARLHHDRVNVMPWRADAALRAHSDLALFGVAKELMCQRPRVEVNCRASVLWELHDGPTGRVLYTTTTRAAVYGVGRERLGAVGVQLIGRLVDSLVKRPGFKRQLTLDPGVTTDFPPATFKRCSSSGLTLPRQAEEATQATVVVRNAYGFGSGFFLNDDGLLVTAAHVVRYPGLSILLRDGRVVPAAVVRANAAADVALVRAEVEKSPRCLDIAPGAPSLGADVYVIGTPAGAQQAFSLSRGIVSALRDFDGLHVVQTDASISPGNSGGPLLDTDGRVLGVVSRKVVREDVEGVAYGVSVEAMLKALGLSPGGASSSELSMVLPPVVEEPMEREPDDALPSLDSPNAPPVGIPPEHARTMDAPSPDRRAHAPEATKRRPAPAYVAVLEWGGIAVGTAGLVMVAKSMLDDDPGSTTRREFASLQRLNGVGWALTGVGAAAVGASVILRPLVTPPPVRSADASRAPGFGLALSGRY